MPAIKFWIVAIEKYSVGGATSGDPPDLPGIADWALQLAEFLALPSGRKNDIVLNISPMDAEACGARLKALDIDYAGATLAEIRTSIRKLKSDIEDTLIVYWAGHGVGAAGDRYLLTADSCCENLEGLSVNNLLLHLRSSGFPGVQMGFIDACAEPFLRPNAYNLSAGSAAQIRQFYYFAASANELASGSREALGFSSEVVRHLKLAGGVPLDPRAFCAQLDKAFEELIAQGTLQSRPFDVEYTRESGDQWSQPGFQGPSYLNAEARRAHLTTPQFEFLFRELKDCPWLWKKPTEAAAELGLDSPGVPPEQQAAALLSEVVRLDMVPQMLERLRRHDAGHRGNENLEGAWNRLQLELEFLDASWSLRLPLREWKAAARQIRDLDLLPPPEKEPSNIEELQLGILDQRDFPRAQLSLIRLLEAAGRLGMKQNHQAYSKLVARMKNHKLLGALYQKAVDAIPTSDARIYLSIGIEMDNNTRECSVSRARVRDSEGAASGWLDIPDAGLAEQVFALIDRVKREHVRPLLVELLLPANLLCYGREFLKITDEEFGDSWIERENAVVLRWHERLASLRNPHPKYKVGDWFLAAENVRPHAAGADFLICRWSDPGGPLPAPGAECHVVGLNFPGPNEQDPACNKQAFFAALRTGAPYMCWPRQKTEGSLENEAAGLFADGLRKLPELLTRKKGAGSLVDLLLLMDDPKADPYSDKLKTMQTNPGRKQ